MHFLANILFSIFSYFTIVYSISFEDYYLRSGESRRMIVTPKAATFITPVKASAVFFDSSRIGFWTGLARGSINFAQANFPDHPATVIDIVLFFPPSQHNRTYLIEILFSGNLDQRYCEKGKRYIELHKFKLPADEIFYMRSLKSHDVNVIDEDESVIARTIRIICADCKYRSEKMGGCSIIGRVDDEVYTERNDEPIQYMNGLSLGLPPGARFLIRDLAPKFYRQRFG